MDQYKWIRRKRSRYHHLERRWVENGLKVQFVNVPLDYRRWRDFFREIQARVIFLSLKCALLCAGRVLRDGQVHRLTILNRVTLRKRRLKNYLKVRHVVFEHYLIAYLRDFSQGKKKKIEILFSPFLSLLVCAQVRVVVCCVTVVTKDCLLKSVIQEGRVKPYLKDDCGNLRNFPRNNRISLSNSSVIIPQSAVFRAGVVTRGDGADQILSILKIITWEVWGLKLPHKVFERPFISTKTFAVIQ